MWDYNSFCTPSRSGTHLPLLAVLPSSPPIVNGSCCWWEPALVCWGLEKSAPAAPGSLSRRRPAGLDGSSRTPCSHYLFPRKGRMAEILPQKNCQTFMVLPGTENRAAPVQLRQTQPDFFRKPCGEMICGQVRMDQVILTDLQQSTRGKQLPNTPCHRES